MPVLKIIFDICLLRGRPQDLPASKNLLWLTMLATLVTGYARVVRIDEPSFGGLVLVLFQTVIFGAAVWIVLKMRDHPERWLQSAAALYAVNTFFNLLRLPVLPQLVEAGKRALEAFQRGTPAPIGWELLFASATDVWYLLVMAQILRHAIELPLGLSALISFFTLVMIFMVEIQFIALFSLPAAT